MILKCIIGSLSICITTHIITRYLYNQNDKLCALNQRFEMRNYEECGAIKKVKIAVKTYPNETTGLRSLIYHSEWVTLEEAEKRKKEISN